MNAGSADHGQLFDAELWVRENLNEAQTLKRETLQIVAGFTLLWNLFEGLVCKGQLDRQTFKHIIQNLPRSSELDGSVDESIEFYRIRYVSSREMKPIFYGLHFRDCEIERREHVEAVLKGELGEFDDKVLALLFIVCRIRNNMFHGLKSVDVWNNQAINISQASRVLSLIVKAEKI